MWDVESKQSVIRGNFKVFLLFHFNYIRKKFFNPVKEICFASPFLFLKKSIYKDRFEC